MCLLLLSVTQAVTIVSDDRWAENTCRGDRRWSAGNIGRYEIRLGCVRLGEISLESC